MEYNALEDTYAVKLCSLCDNIPWLKVIYWGYEFYQTSDPKLYYKTLGSV